MPDLIGRFVWFELLTTDPDAAAAFYGSVIGWLAADSGMPDVAYTVLSAGDAAVGGLMRLPPHLEGVPPHWTGYIAVADVDAHAALVAAKGGAVHRAPGDIPGVGRFAVVADPAGAHFVLFAPVAAQERTEAPDGAAGHVGWRELRAGEPEASLAFYGEIFGWTKAETLDMGPMGPYQLFAIGGASAGGMMRKPDFVPVPSWLYYVNVGALDAAIARVDAGGGEIMHGPQEVPGGSWIAICRDPQGAAFAMVSPRR